MPRSPRCAVRGNQSRRLWPSQSLSTARNNQLEPDEFPLECLGCKAGKKLKQLSVSCEMSCLVSSLFTLRRDVSALWACWYFEAFDWIGMAWIERWCVIHQVLCDTELVSLDTFNNALG